MKIIPPHRNKSLPVSAYSSIEPFVKGMLELVDRNDHSGLWKEALALHHSQVDPYPYDFFVLNSKMAEHFNGHRVIINPEIISEEDPVRFQEACMSWPFRNVINTKRSNKLKVRFCVPRTLFGIPVFTGYLSGHFTQALLDVELELTGIPAFVFQHEYDHGQGLCVFDRFKK